MKSRIRILALLLVFLLALPLFGGVAQATNDIGLGGLGETVTETQLEDAAIEYVDRYIETAFLYGDPSLTENTLLSLVNEEPIGTSAVLQNGYWHNSPGRCSGLGQFYRHIAVQQKLYFYPERHLYDYAQCS